MRVTCSYFINSDSNDYINDMLVIGIVSNILYSIFAHYIGGPTRKVGYLGFSVRGRLLLNGHTLSVGSGTKSTENNA